MIKAISPLNRVIIFGLLLRVLFVLYSNHIYDPDEIFQTLEISHRLVYGYGLIPWDYVYGLRSFVTPLLLSLPLAFFKLVGLNQPIFYTFGIKLLLILCSLVLIYAAYYITLKVSKSRQTALFAGFTIAIWYELIYTASRSLNEIFATYLIAASIIVFLGNKPSYFFFSLLLTSAAFLRLQYIPAIVLGLWLFKSNLQGQAKNLLTGILLITTVFGLADYWFYGTFLIHPINNVKLSLLSGISQEFGIQPWWFYVIALVTTSAGLILFLLSRTQFAFNKKALLLLGIIIGTHSLIPHKEYRFIFVVIPLYLIIISPSILTVLKRKAYLTVATISCLGFVGILPFHRNLYHQPMLLQDPVLTQNASPLAVAPDCSVYLPDRDWVYTGGSYYQHTHEIYSNDYVPNKDFPPSLVIQPNPLNEPGDAYIKVGQNTLYEYYLSPQPCQKNRSYASVRSFEYLNKYLENTSIVLKWLK